ncbi:MAG: AAA family ATPase, partial [Bacteroidaceae bacterium]|nr:AAA family ATPase [Bacteroidaceae bacterium]
DNLLQNEANSTIGVFDIKSANKWMEQAALRPIPKMLFSEFWYEGELCILFADTNVGKSILAVQIGNSITKGIAIPGFKLESEAQKILYFDFELTDKQFQGRYSKNYIHSYHFSENFLRVEIDVDAELPDGISFENYLNNSIEQAIIETEAKILIIDNITYLKHENEKAKDALPLMKHLKKLKNKYNLSLLILAHTPKRDLSKQLTRNDLQGSKMLMNFCDSSFAIGESFSDKSLRYIKMIKVRSCEHIYDAENVIVCQINKPSNFLQFEFLNFDNEAKHLKVITDKDRQKLESEIQQCINEDQNATAYSIAKKLCPQDRDFNSFKVTVSRIVKRLKENGNP